MRQARLPLSVQLSPLLCETIDSFAQKGDFSMSGYISETEIGRFVSYLREEERSAATVEKYRREVVRFSAWLENR